MGGGPRVPMEASGLQWNWQVMSALFSLNHACSTIPLIFATTLLNEHLGYTGSALLYVFTCISSLFLSAPVVISIGQRAGLFLGMALYSAYVGAFTLAITLPPGSSAQWVLFCTGSCLGGSAASIVWTAQGSYLDCSVSRLAELEGDDREAVTSQHASTFAVHYLLSEVVLKLVVSFGLERTQPWMAFALCTVLALASTLGVMNLVVFGPAPGGTHPNFSAKLLAAVALWREPSLWCLSLTNLTFGFAAAFLNGYVNASYTKVQLGRQFVGYFATTTALVAALFSRLFGMASVQLGTKGPFILLGSLCFLAIPALVLLLGLEGWGHWLVIMYILQGCGRAVYESTNKGVFADFFPGPQAQGAFANQMMQSTLSFTICFFFSAVLPRGTLAAIILAFASLTFPCYVLAKRLSLDSLGMSNNGMSPFEDESSETSSLLD